MKLFKEQSTEFHEEGIHVHIRRGDILLLRETLTILRSKDIIHRWSASFWEMIHVYVSVIIPLLKKKALTINSL